MKINQYLLSLGYLIASFHFLLCDVINAVIQVTDIQSNSAMKKLLAAAAMYDRTQAGMLPLDAFDIETMKPEIFRLNLRQTFDLSVTVSELTVIIKLLNKENPEEDNINCGKFLVFFLRLGFQERSKKLKEHWLQQKIAKELTNRKQSTDMIVFEERNALKKINENDLKFDKIDCDRAMTKLREAAKLHVMGSKGVVPLGTFEVSHMHPHEFKEQLKRVFKINLTSAEIGSILSKYSGKNESDVDTFNILRMTLNEDRSLYDTLYH